MKRQHYLTIILFSGLIFLSFLVTDVSAKTCEEDYLYYNNGGVVPPTNSSLVSNCSWIQSITGTAVASASNNCKPTYENHTIQYCKQKTSSVSTATGNVFIYSTNPRAGGKNVFKFTNLNTGQNINYDRVPIPNDLIPKETGVFITQGESYVLNFGEQAAEQGTGWRKIDFNSKIYANHKTFVENVRAQAAANGYEIIAEQYWADAETSSKYDTYDFEDVPIIIAVKNPAPKCEDHRATLTVSPLDDPAIIYLSEKANYAISINDASVYKNPSNVFTIDGFASLQFANGLLNNANQKCNLSLGIQTCAITNRVSFNKAQNYNTKVAWTHNYQVCNGAACNNCSETKEFAVYPYPGFIKTINNGSTYIGKTVNIKRLPNGQFFTDRLLLTQSNAFNTFQPTNKIIKPNESGVTTLATNYKDANNRENFYDWFKSKLLSEPKFSDIYTRDSLMINNSLLTILKLKETEVDLVHVKGDAIIDDTSVVSCVKPTIFVIDGNLTIQQNLQIPANYDTACFFLVGNKTTVAASVVNIDAFIVTKSAATEVEGSLSLKGGLIIQGYNADSTTLLKNINATVVEANNIQKETPSELLQYDGARYVNIFNDYLKEPFQLSIREIQYTNN